MSANPHYKSPQTSNHSQSTRPMAASSSSPSTRTGLPTPAASPQTHSSASSPSPSVSSLATANQPRRMHNMSISSILSPDDAGATSCHQPQDPASETPSSSVYSSGSRGSVAEDQNSTQVFTWNEDPKKIDDMLRSLNPDSPEWVVWKDWADFLAEEKENQAREQRAAAAAAAAAQGTG
ncbi:hypothetical protein SLS57_012280 [Botryosphaeria dothidea]